MTYLLSLQITNWRINKPTKSVESYLQILGSWLGMLGGFAHILVRNKIGQHPQIFLRKMKAVWPKVGSNMGGSTTRPRLHKPPGSFRLVFVFPKKYIYFDTMQLAIQSATHPPHQLRSIHQVQGTSTSPPTAPQYHQISKNSRRPMQPPATTTKLHIQERLSPSYQFAQGEESVESSSSEWQGSSSSECRQLGKC